MSKQQIGLPHAGVVVLIGPSNSGKTTFLNHLVEQGVLQRSEVISSDQVRILIGDNDYISWAGKPQEEADLLREEYGLLSKHTFEAIATIIGHRCRLGRLSVIDATHLWPEDRQLYLSIAGKHHVPAIAIAFDVPEKVLLERDRVREQPRGSKRIKSQVHAFQKHIRSMKKEGFRASYMLNTQELADAVFYRRTNPQEIEADMGLDFVGDVHGCYVELIELLETLGYVADAEGLYQHPEGRKIVSVGDVMSRGPQSIETMLFFKRHVDAGLAYIVDSNHGWKIARWLDGKQVTLTHGDEKVAAEFAEFELQHGSEATERLKAELRDFLLAAPSNLVFTRAGIRRIAVAHAGIRDHYIGKDSRRIRDFCRYGDVAGFDEKTGKPIRRDWFMEHQSSLPIIWGHDPKPEPLMINNTINIDQGVVFGGQLTAYRFPEKQFVSVQAKQDYSGASDNPLLQEEPVDPRL